MPNMQTRQGEFINIDGNLIEKDVYEIGKRIGEYDDRLSLHFVDPARGANINDAPFVVCETGRDGKLYKVLEAWTLDASILERIEAADTTRRDLLAVIDGKNVVFENDRNRRFEERRLENMEIAEAVLRDHKSRYSFKDPHTDATVTIYDDRPSERKTC